MGEAKQGQSFIQHEFDEAIVVQQAIVDAEQVLADAHPMKEAQTAIKRMSKDDEQCLQDLKQLGRKFGATGKVEEVAGAMQELSQTTTKSAEEAPSEAYEAHAVLLAMLRKQQDSSAAIVKIAREMNDDEIKEAAVKMQKQAKSEADEMADLLSQLAVQIATGNGQSMSAR
jgi:hypothetical protein